MFTLMRLEVEVRKYGRVMKIRLIFKTAIGEYVKEIEIEEGSKIKTELNYLLASDKIKVNPKDDFTKEVYLMTYSIISFEIIG